MQHLRGDFGFKLNQQHRNRLRVLALDQRDQRRWIEPARQFDGRAAVSAGRQDPLHHALTLDLADRLVQHPADVIGPPARTDPALLGIIDKAADRLGDLVRPDMTQRAHLFSEQAQFIGAQLAQDLCGLIFFEQHNHHRCAVGIAKAGDVGSADSHGVAAAFDVPSSARSALSASSGFSSTIRCASPTCLPSSAVSAAVWT